MQTHTVVYSLINTFQSKHLSQTLRLTVFLTFRINRYSYFSHFTLIMSSSKRLRTSSVSTHHVNADMDDSLQFGDNNTTKHWTHASKLNQRLAHLFRNEYLADVSFKFDDNSGDSKPIKAHRLVLRSASLIFDSMFDKSLNGNAMKDEVDSDDEHSRELLTIEVHDCDYNALKRVIQYLYTDYIDINETNVMSIISAAKKFGVECVIDIAVEFASEQLNRNNSFEWYATACELDECKLKNKCLDMIANNAQYVISCEAFLKISNSQLCELLARDDLCIDEYDLFNAIIRWCDSSNKSNDSFRNINVKLRDIIGDAFHLIRFPIMSFANFCRILQIFSDLFSHEEMISIIEYINVGKNGDNLRFPTKKRNFY